MLLVHHDQTEVIDRREHRRAWSHAHPRLARPQPAPLRVALGRTQLGVQHGDRVAEALYEAGHYLRRQRDLRDQHDHPAPLRQRQPSRAHVHLGLARAGHAVQQPPLRAARTERVGEHIEDGRLVCGQLRRPRGRRAFREVARGRHGAAFSPAQAPRRTGRQAVLLRHPLGHRNQVRRHAQLKGAPRSQQPVGLHLA